MIRRLGRLTGLASSAAVVAFWMVMLRPVSLGGPATYVVVRGDSMLPGFQAGDLVILQASDGYGAGDVVGYRIPQGEVGAGLIVVHRIVGGDGQRGFTLMGDNNPAPDPWLPDASDVAGRVWLQVPGLGRAIVFLHQPVAAGALAVSLLVMLVLARRRPGSTAVRGVPLVYRSVVVPARRGGTNGVSQRTVLRSIVVAWIRRPLTSTASFRSTRARKST